MFRFFLDLTIDLFCYIFDNPSIKMISKTTIMGNVVDRTIEYYTHGISVSPLDDRYIIKYVHKNKDFMLSTEKHFLEEALLYIKTLKEFKHIDYIHAAHALVENSPEDVTNLLKMFAGPYGNFYKDTHFHTIPINIKQCSDMVVIMKNLELISLNVHQRIYI